MQLIGFKHINLIGSKKTKVDRYKKHSKVDVFKLNRCINTYSQTTHIYSLYALCMYVRIYT